MLCHRPRCLASHPARMPTAPAGVVGVGYAVVTRLDRIGFCLLTRSATLDNGVGGLLLAPIGLGTFFATTHDMDTHQPPQRSRPLVAIINTATETIELLSDLLADEGMDAVSAYVTDFKRGQRSLEDFFAEHQP